MLFFWFRSNDLGQGFPPWVEMWEGGGGDIFGKWMGGWGNNIRKFNSTGWQNVCCAYIWWAWMKGAGGGGQLKHVDTIRTNYHIDLSRTAGISLQ